MIIPGNKWHPRIQPFLRNLFNSAIQPGIEMPGYSRYVPYGTKGIAIGTPPTTTTISQRRRAEGIGRCSEHGTNYGQTLVFAFTVTVAVKGELQKNEAQRISNRFPGKRMKPADPGQVDKKKTLKPVVVIAVLLVLVLLPTLANPKTTNFLPENSLIKAILQIIGTVYLGLFFWIFLVFSLISAPAVNPFHKLQERYRSILHRLPDRKALRSYGMIALTIVLLFLVWLIICHVLFNANDTRAWMWFLFPLAFVVLGIFMLVWVGFLRLIAPVGGFIFDVLSLPIRIVATRLGVEEFGALLESLGVVLIGLSLVFEHFPLDKDMTHAAQQFFVSMHETHWLERIGVLSAAAGGTYRIVKHLTRKERPAQ